MRSQFFDLKGIADLSMQAGKVRLPPVMFQPMAADDVANALADVALVSPVNGLVEIAGPQPFRLDELVRRRLAALDDRREVISDPTALYSGASVSAETLMPGARARRGAIPFETWLTTSALPIPARKVS